MKVICDRQKLHDALAVVNNVIPTKSTKPVLENLCLVATDTALELLGTDLESSVRYRIDGVQVDEPGPAVVPARVTLDFVRDLSGDTVTLATHENKCVISSGAGAWRWPRPRPMGAGPRAARSSRRSCRPRACSSSAA